MSSTTHRKHTALARPDYGHFAVNEWAFVGTTCADIKDLSGRILAALPQYRFGYVDVRHMRDGEEAELPGQLKHGAAVEWSREGSHHRIDLAGGITTYAQRQPFQSCDAALVNGNHFEAAAQVVILDPVKKASLEKRMDQLNNVVLVLRKGDTELYDFLQTHIGADVPVLNLADTDAIAAFFNNRLELRRPPINGLVLAGGQSLRLGRDKGRIDWHGREQRYHLADQLYKYCTNVRISCRPDQVQEIDPNYQPLPDSFTGLGPYGALLSAFREDPSSAWLVVACDMPFFSEAAIESLIQQRHPSALATTFASPRNGSPEPLAAIWEPRSYPVLLQFLGQGISCPRKVLFNNIIHLITPTEPNWTMNVNTKEDFVSVKKQGGETEERC